MNKRTFNPLEASGVNPDFWNRYVRPIILKRAGNKCEFCSSTENLDVHHNEYDNQIIETFKVLCRRCHLEWHQVNQAEI